MGGTTGGRERGVREEEEGNDLKDPTGSHPVTSFPVRNYPCVSPN